MTKKYEAIQVVIFRKEKRKRRKNRGRTCDSKSTVTVLSHAAVTPLLIHCQMFKYKHVTGDSKFSLFNGSSSNSVLVKLIERLMDKGISAY